MFSTSVLLNWITEPSKAINTYRVILPLGYTTSYSINRTNNSPQSYSDGSVQSIRATVVCKLDLLSFKYYNAGQEVYFITLGY